MATDSGEIVVAIPLYDRFTALDAVGPYEVLHWVPNVVVIFVAEVAGQLVKADSGHLSMQATSSYDDLPSPHVIVVPGGFGTTAALSNQRLLQWIKQAHATSMYTTSVCSGSIILASLDLLNGLPATTYWNSYNNLARFGAIPTEQRVVHQGKIITSAGVSAGIDMALQLVRILKGEEMSKMIQLFIEYDPQPPFDVGSPSKAKVGGILEKTKKLYPKLAKRCESTYYESIKNKD